MVPSRHVPAHQGIIDADREHPVLGLSRRGQQVDQLARGQVDRLGQVARPYLRALDVHQKRDVALGPAADLADPPDHRARPRIVGVGHVEPADVGPRQDQLLEHRLVLRRGAEREDDLGQAEGRLGRRAAGDGGFTP